MLKRANITIEKSFTLYIFNLIFSWYHNLYLKYICIIFIKKKEIIPKGIRITELRIKVR